MSKVSAYMIKVFKFALSKVYQFDRWHIAALDDRPYAKDVIAYANTIDKRERCVEIGCGLGDIVRNLNFEHRVGLDNDENVLKAARFINRITAGSVEFSKFSFPGDELRGRFNLIVMVNWIHHIEPTLLRRKLEEFEKQNLHKEGEIIIDTVQDPAYKFNHDIKFLVKNMNGSLTRIGLYDRGREVWSIKKTI